MKKALNLLAAAIGLGTSLTAGAGTISYNVSTLFNGTAPTSTGPLITAVFEDLPNGAGVRLTLTSGFEVSSEYVDMLGFNFNPTKKARDLVVVKDGLVPEATVTRGSNNQQVVGGGDDSKGFDILLDWSNANDAVARFNQDDSDQITFKLDGLKASDFDFANTAGIHIAAHINGIPGNKSGAIRESVVSQLVVNLPDRGATVLLLGAGLVGVGLAGRRVRNAGGRRD